MTFVVCLALAHALFLPNSCNASENDDARRLFRIGDYESCEKLVRTQVDRGIWNDIWPRMLIETLLTVGRYEDATKVFEKEIDRFRDNLRLRLQGVQCYRMTNQPQKALQQLEIAEQILVRTQLRFTSTKDLIPIGEFFLQRGEDPKQVLKLCFDHAIQADPKLVEAHVATARMALQKNDQKVAAKSLSKALELDDSDPEIFYLLSRAWSNTDPDKATGYLQRSLEINKHYIPSMLVIAESKMASEDYAAAKDMLDQIERVNPRLPKMWALRAAISHLQGRYEEEGEFRRKGLEPWSLNPEVDFTIGKELSSHYRFADAVVYQRRALTMDENYTPAASQLSQDLLRMGNTQEGWELVDRVRTKDPYDVTIFNLKQLQSQLQKFTILEPPGFVIRMDPREAKIYGDDVIDVLSEARDVLTQKYSVTLEEPIFVEIFPKQKEFAIRTLGLPGGEGLLGVCFGRLITANSPAALSVDYNWKAVLWHEYCHVVTLQKTKNKMPRWLSEGISVYEERQRNSTWGQSMDPIYREMILGEDYVPISQLSSAFLRPKTPMHLQFAYFQSSLAVEFWIETYGMKSLLRVLDDLSIGMPPDEALKRVPGSMELLDNDFRVFAEAKAKGFAPNVDFKRPKEPKNIAKVRVPKGPQDPKKSDGASGDLTDDLGLGQPDVKPAPQRDPSEEPTSTKNTALNEKSNPDSYWNLRTVCERFIQQKEWDQALEVAKKLESIFPEDASTDGLYHLLSLIYRGKGDEGSEREAAVTLVSRSADAKDTLLRLVELDRKREDWTALEQWSKLLHEIQPLRADIQNVRAVAAERLGKHKVASQALSACLELEPTDRSNIHFRLAVALNALGETNKAKRQVLKALEDAPRYVEALKLFSEICSKEEKTNAALDESN